MTMPESIRAKLAEKREAVSASRRRTEILEAELRGWEEAMGIFAEAEMPTNAPASVDGQPAAARSFRGPSDQWRNIFAATAAIYPKAASLDEITVMAEKLGTPINRNTLRSQASIYADRGYLERMTQGEYRLTQMGADQFAVKLGVPPAPKADDTDDQQAA